MVVHIEEQKLKELLTDLDVITDDELDRALEVQENIGGQLEEVLIKLGYTTEDRLVNVVAEEQNMETVNLSEMSLPEKLIRKIPRELIENHEVVPVRLDGEKIQVAIHNPFNLEPLEEVGLATNFSVEPVLAPRASILKTIDELYYDEDQEQATEAGRESELKPEEEEEENESTPRDPVPDTDGEPEPDIRNVSTPELLHGLVDLLVEKNVVSEEELIETIKKSDSDNR